LIIGLAEAIINSGPKKERLDGHKYNLSQTLDSVNAISPLVLTSLKHANLVDADPFPSDPNNHHFRGGLRFHCPKSAFAISDIDTQKIGFYHLCAKIFYNLLHMTEAHLSGENFNALFPSFSKLFVCPIASPFKPQRIFTANVKTCRRPYCFHWNYQSPTWLAIAIPVPFTITQFSDEFSAEQLLGRIFGFDIRTFSWKHILPICVIILAQ